MIRHLREVQARRRGQELVESGFTLIELLVVIVVLGILAAVVIFALTGVTGQSATAACQADGATISGAMADFATENPGAAITFTSLIEGTDEDNNTSYIQSAPDNTPHYAFEISTAAGAPDPAATQANELQVSINPAGNVDPSDQSQ